MADLKIREKQSAREIELKDEKIGLLQRELENKEGDLQRLRSELSALKESQRGEVDSIQLQEMKKRLKQFENQELQFKMKESTYLDQISLQKSSLEEVKGLYEKVLQTLKPQGEQEPFNVELLQTNNNLSKLLSKSEGKIKSLEEKVNFYKEYKTLMQMSKSLRCSKCSKEMSFNQFKAHVEECTGEEQQTNNLQNLNNQNQTKSQDLDPQMPAETYVRIDDFSINSSQKSNIFMEYVVQVFSFNKSWIVKKKYNQFCKLYEGLKEKYPYVKMPPSAMTLMISYTDIGSMKNINHNFEQKKKSLEKFLNELLRNPQLKKTEEV